MKKNFWTNEKIQFLIDNYFTKTYAEMVDVLGCNTRAIGYQAKKLGLAKGRGRGRFRTSPDKYEVNQEYFQSLNENSSYILGFIGADGHVDSNKRNRVSITIHNNDIEILDFIKDEIVPNAHISKRKDRNHSTLCFSGSKIINTLLKLGLDNRKTQISNILDKIPYDLHRHFIRGFFDGDGCLSYRKRTRGKYTTIDNYFTITNNDCKLLNNIQKTMQCCSVTKCRTWYVLRTSNLKVISEIYDYLYTDANFYLKRKKDKFESLFKEKQCRTL